MAPAARADTEEYDPAGDYAYDPTLADAVPADAEAEADDGDDDEEYDPEPAEPRSPSMPPSQGGMSSMAAVEDDVKLQPAEAAAAAPVTAKQPPRTKGGFVDESEDDEDDVPVAGAKAGPALLNAAGISDSPKRSATLSPSNAQNQPQQNVPPLHVQNQGVSGLVPSSVAVHESFSSVPNGSTPVPDAKQAPLPAASARQSAAPATPISALLPKSRLPQDKVGMFEDRIAEDPRGDIEAWLGLVDEYRKRHKYAEARATYDEFFKVFPTAVRIPLFFCQAPR